MEKKHKDFILRLIVSVVILMSIAGCGILKQEDDKPTEIKDFYKVENTEGEVVNEVKEETTEEVNSEISAVNINTIESNNYIGFKETDYEASEVCSNLYDTNDTSFHVSMDVTYPESCKLWYRMHEEGLSEQGSYLLVKASLYNKDSKSVDDNISKCEVIHHHVNGDGKYWIYKDGRKLETAPFYDYDSYESILYDYVVTGDVDWIETDDIEPNRSIIIENLPYSKDDKVWHDQSGVYQMKGYITPEQFNSLAVSKELEVTAQTDSTVRYEYSFYLYRSMDETEEGLKFFKASFTLSDGTKIRYNCHKQVIEEALGTICMHQQ